MRDFCGLVLRLRSISRGIYATLFGVQQYELATGKKKGAAAFSQATAVLSETIARELLTSWLERVAVVNLLSGSQLLDSLGIGPNLIRFVRA